MLRSPDTSPTFSALETGAPFVPEPSDMPTHLPEYTAADDQSVVDELKAIVEASVTDADRAADESVLAELREKTPPRYLGETDQGLQTFANREIAERARPTYSADELLAFRRLFKEKGTFDSQFVWREVTVEGDKQQLPFMPATKINPNHGDMCKQTYLRDQVMAARSAMHLYLLDREEYATEGELGRILIASTLHALSTPHQLARCDKVIALGPQAEQKDWPFISVLHDDMNSTAEDNHWRNIQNSLQMLGDLTLEALEEDFITADNLTGSNLQFLTAVPPMLASVGFPHYGNSGSWEEIKARRSSVMSPETALADKMHRLLAADGIAGAETLQAAYNRRQDTATQPLTTLLSTLLSKGLAAFGRRLPYESPDYQPESIKYRRADAALVDVLQYGIPELMEKHQIRMACAGDQIASAAVVRSLVVTQLKGLMDPATGGMWRYGERTPDGVQEQDSYLGQDYMSPSAQRKVATNKVLTAERARQLNSAPDLDLKQRLRNEAITPGRQAAWPHPVGQVGMEEAKQYFRAIEQGRPEDAKQHLKNAFYFFNQMLRTITGEGEHTVALQADGSSAVQPVPDFVVPEARVPYGELDIPSPHSPLYWGVWTLREFLAHLEKAVRHAEATATTEQAANRKLGQLGLIDTPQISAA